MGVDELSHDEAVQSTCYMTRFLNGSQSISADNEGLMTNQSKTLVELEGANCNFSGFE